MWIFSSILLVTIRDHLYVPPNVPIDACVYLLPFCDIHTCCSSTWLLYETPVFLGQIWREIKQAKKTKRKTVCERIPPNTIFSSSYYLVILNQMSPKHETITDSGSTFRGFCSPITSMHEDNLQSYGHYDVGF